jgi:serine/threonine protein kinase
MTGDVLVGHKISGTRGYHAPETLKWKHYSPRSDIWQAGCCLYSMLSGFSPFHPDNDTQALDAKYAPMIGPVWASISDRAKDLVSRILVADPEKRITIPEILLHPWMTSEAPENDLGGEYVTRIKHLALRQRIKGFFLQDGLGESRKVRRDHLAEILPFLKPTALTKFSSYVSVNSDAGSPSKFKIMRNASSTSLSSGPRGSEHGMGSHSSHNTPHKSTAQALTEKTVVEFNHKLQVFQDLVIESFREKYLHANTSESSLSPMSIGFNCSKDDLPSFTRQSITPLSSLSIEYPEFAELLNKAGLAHLAEPTVFSIFDTTNSGSNPFRLTFHNL